MGIRDILDAKDITHFVEFKLVWTKQDHRIPIWTNLEQLEKNTELVWLK